MEYPSCEATASIRSLLNSEDRCLMAVGLRIMAHHLQPLLEDEAAVNNLMLSVLSSSVYISGGYTSYFSVSPLSPEDGMFVRMGETASLEIASAGHIHVNFDVPPLPSSVEI